MKTIDEMIAVMTAAKEGKAIECKFNFNDKDPWEICETKPVWNWHGFDYRVKSEQKYRPYKNAEEFLKGMKEHGLYMRWQDDDNLMFLPYLFKKDGVVFSTDGIIYSWRDVLKMHCWQDGSPCGVLEE